MNEILNALRTLLSKNLEYAQKVEPSSSFIVFCIMTAVSYIFIRYPYVQVPGVSDINFFIHEFGHILAMDSSSLLLLASSGTIFELLLPTIFTIYMFLRGRYLESAFFLCWLGTNLSYVGIYMMDTIKRTMPMSQIFGPDSKHDWEVIFGHYGVTMYAIDIGDLVLRSSQLMMCFACAYVGWLLLYGIYWRLKGKIK